MQSRLSTSGWMVGELFLQFMHHLVANVRPTTENPMLLLLDNHHSHLDIKVLNFAKSNGVTLLSFPPNCSHKLQPLDVSVFGPLKKLINASQGNWMRNNPGKTMTIYDLPGIMREAWPLAAVQKNIIKGFEVAGIFPFNPEVFTDADYAPSFVTDRPYNESTNPNQSSLTEESKDRPNDNLPSAHTDCEVLIPNNQDTLQK